MSANGSKVAHRAENVLIDKAVGAAIDCVAVAAFSAYGFLSGSFERVAAFASENPEAAVSWSAALVLTGAAVGFAVRHVFAVKKLKRELEAKDAEIDKLRRGIVKMEDMSQIMENLPDDMAEQIEYIYSRGGSMNAEPCGVLQALVNERLLIMDGATAGVPYWRLSRGSMKYMDEKNGRIGGR